ncbi:MAG: NADH-quinone oxidoreductase subunit [Proteobacteria bacterium]|nr:NADH-quinone oxidoreductase subunit [Pseudomonadota bacterium]
MEHILSLLVFFPAMAGLLGFLVTKESIRAYGISVSAIEFFLSLVLWIGFDGSNAGYQFVEYYPFIPSYGMSYYLGVDGISLFLVILSTFITMIAFIALSIKNEIKNLIISVLFLEMTMVGVFLILDVIWFYAFWELSLVPMLYIIGAWGSANRMYASIKFFLYTFAGSVLMLVGILYMGFLYHEATGIWSFALPDWYLLQIPFGLPYAHGQAPTIGSIILAAVLLKMGSYGFVRFSLPLFPDASVYFLIPVATICIIMVIYAAMIAYAQEDMKQVIAYSSISHMGIVVLGTFAMNAEGITGSIFLMLSHGIVSGALFMLVGVIYDRRHTKMMKDFGGLASVMPNFATIYGIMLMASVGLPLTIGFVGEFLSLVGFYRINWIMALLAGTGIILGAVYMLVLYKKSFFGAIVHEENKTLQDLNAKELTALIPLVALVVMLGVYPKPVLSAIDMSVQKMLVLMEQKAVDQSTKDLIIKANTIGGTH